MNFIKKDLVIIKGSLVLETLKHTKHMAIFMTIFKPLHTLMLYLMDSIKIILLQLKMVEYNENL